MKGRVEVRTLHCSALAGNALGDPVERPCAVYLPPGYDGGTERYPVVLFLHAFLGSALGWLNVAPFAPSTPERIDGLISNGLAPFIGVFPDGWSARGGSQWVDSPASGAYQTMLVQDVLPAVDAAYRTVPRREARAVVGRSSGGYGSWSMVRHHPDAVGHLGAQSADAYFEYCYLPEFSEAAGSLLRAGGVEAFWREFQVRSRETRMRGEDHPVVNVLAMASAYSPAAGAPLGVELPFDLQTGRLREAVWARWLAEDPVRFVPGSGAFAGLVSAFLDCGTRDEFGLRWGTRMLAGALRDAGVDVTHEEYDDGHTGTSYRHARCLEVLAPRLARG